MGYLELFHILDFLRTMSRIETIKKELIDKAKRKVFDIVGLYLRNTEEPPIHEVVTLYCKLTPIGYPDINKLSFFLLEKLELLLNEI